MKDSSRSTAENRIKYWANAPVIGLFALAAFSQAKLQTVEKASTLALGSETKRFKRTFTDRAIRGAIYTSDGEPLAKDDERYDLTVVFADCPDTPAFWVDLGQASGIAATELSSMAESGQKSASWPEAVTREQKIELDNVQFRWRAKGVSTLFTGRRAYPLGAEAACFVGIIRPRFVQIGRDDKRYSKLLAQNGPPKNGSYYVADITTGLESSLNPILKATDGERVGLTDRTGNFLPMRMDPSQKRRRDGESVVLTIDSQLQTLAAQSVKKAVETNRAESGVAVVLDPHNGDILAMANWPSFNPYNPDGSIAPMGPHGGFDPAYMSCLEPGSMFKVLTLARALESGVHMSDHMYCTGEWKVQARGKAISCDDHKAHHDVDARLAIAESCNISAAHWALKIGYDPFVQYLHDMGLLRRTQLGLKGETSALFNTHDPAKVMQLATLGFGQSINCSPVALAGAFGAIANDGVRMEPRLIKEVGGTELKVEPGRAVLKPESCAMVRQAMVSVFEDPAGTGHKLAIEGYHLAGKTGTAQKLGRRQHGHVSNFVGFVPAAAPRAVVLVMVNEPQVAYHGAAVAGPVFVELAKGIIRKFHLAPDSGAKAEFQAPKKGKSNDV